MIYEITGKDNKTVKLIKALKKKSNRTEEKLFVAEGKRICDEAFKYASDRIYCVVVTKDFFEKEKETVSKAENVCDKVFVVSQTVFDDISDTDTPQGILCVIKIHQSAFEVDEKWRNIVILDGVSEPGNMGTVIRTAEALGFDGILIMKGCADIYSSKTVRSTMGSVFRMKFKTGCEKEDIVALQKKGFSIIATTPEGEVSLEKFDIPEKIAVVIGNEAHGVSDEVLNLADSRVKITMDGLAESLNAAVAAGIVMHWVKNNSR